MNPFADRPVSARYDSGKIRIVMESGFEIAFPVKGSPRLEGKPETALDNIEVSPFGLHWPDLDEDLSIRGILASDFGQSDRHHPARAWRAWRGVLSGSTALQDHVRERREEVEGKLPQS